MFCFFFSVDDHQSIVAFYLEFANVIDVPQPSSVFALFFFWLLVMTLGRTGVEDVPRLVILFPARLEPQRLWARYCPAPRAS